MVELADIGESPSTNPSLDDLRSVEGVGPAKAKLIAAAIKFARRRIQPEGIKESSPKG
jgi:DNA repair protein RadC